MCLNEVIAMEKDLSFRERLMKKRIERDEQKRWKQPQT